MHTPLIITLSLAYTITAFPLLGNLGGDSNPSHDNSAAPNCEGASLISALNCNVVDLALDLDVAPDVDILNGRGLQPGKEERADEPEQGSGPNCEGDSLISALNCNVVDVDAVVDVVPDIDVLGSKEKRGGEEANWDDAAGNGDEEAGDGPNCEGDALFSLLNCNDVGIDLGVDLSPEVDVGRV